jgi:hypothetical protein
MISWDLIGLPYRWGAKPSEGATDCFQLVCEARRRLGLADYTAEFAWVYETYTEETLPDRRIARWLLTKGTRTSTLEPGTICLSTWRAMASWTGTAFLFIAPGGRVCLTERLTGPLFTVP